jgi:hypothetical protein
MWVIEQKARSIQQFEKTANCDVGDRTKSAFDSADVIRAALPFLSSRGIPRDMSCHWSRKGFLAVGY